MKLDKLAFVIILFVLLFPVKGAATSSNPAMDYHDERKQQTLQTLDPIPEGALETKTAGGHGTHVNLGEELPLYSCIPFACMLLSIALLPLVAGTFWHHHFGKIAAFWAASLAIPFVFQMICLC